MTLTELLQFVPDSTFLFKSCFPHYDLSLNSKEVNTEITVRPSTHVRTRQLCCRSRTMNLLHYYTWVNIPCQYIMRAYSFQPMIQTAWSIGRCRAGVCSHLLPLQICFTNLIYKYVVPGESPFKDETTG